MSYQRCPVCNGRGIVPNGFYLYPEGQGFSSSSSAPEECRSCLGTGKILEPEFSNDNLLKILEMIAITKDGDGYHKLREYWLSFKGEELGGNECNALFKLAQAIQKEYAEALIREITKELKSTNDK